MLGPDPRSLAQDHLTGSYILSFEADIVARLLSDETHRLCGWLLGLLNHDHTVRALRDHAAGHYSGALIRLYRLAWHTPGWDTFYDRQFIGQV